MEFQVSLTIRAKRDLKHIGDYIAQDSVEAAIRFCDELVSVSESLRYLPDRHGIFAKHPNIRKLPHGNYLIFYKVNEAAQTVEILRFWHAAQSRNRLRLKEEAPAYA